MPHAPVQVCASGDLVGYVGSEDAPQDRISLTYMVSCLPHLETLDVRKGVASDSSTGVEPMTDAWTPASQRVLLQVADYVAKRSRWCSLERFLYQ
jgi:hypothetical protein